MYAQALTSVVWMLRRLDMGSPVCGVTFRISTVTHGVAPTALDRVSLTDC
jgi:hypothetical protein